MKIFQKTLAITIALIILLPCIIACSSDTSSTNYETVTKKEEQEKVLPIEFIHISRNGKFDFYYDRDTKVIYVTCYRGSTYGDGCAMTPLYNADGTLRTYNEEE